MLEATNIIHQPHRLVSMLVGQPSNVIKRFKQYEESYSGSHLCLAKCAWKCRMGVLTAHAALGKSRLSFSPWMLAKC